MNSATLIPTDITVPDWLQDCLREQETASIPAVQWVEAPDNSAETNLVCDAFTFAYALHKGQKRASGEPYIAHPVAVAGLLRELGGSPTMIAAGFLHDVIEDTDVTAEEIEQRFGAEVRRLVEAVTKLSKFNFSSKTERLAENFRRMFLAMAQDVRVIVVKLADRLHNMRTLEHLPDAKRRSIALETREIFAPLANRLGIGQFKWELEDLAFKYLEPEAYQEIRQLIADKRSDREARLATVAATLRERLDQLGIQCYEISARPKHLYGIYEKMQRQQKSFEEIYDIAAVRLIVQTNDECYRALAVVHDAFRPVPGRFKDYIGLPKPNRYQSLHTVVIGSTGRPLEVQIRTLEMHHVAEYGIAAHWKYKESGGSSAKLTADDEKFTWLRQLLDWQSDLKDAHEYLESVKGNLFDDDVYVFTPNGDVIALAQGATPVDFAYRIHTEVGNRCAGARVNARMVTLDRPLKNGDIVEIITQKNSHPSLDWLNFTVTPGARNRIRQWYKHFHRDDNILRGREMLEKELGKRGFEALLKSEPMQAAAERCNYQTPDDLLAAIGYGEITLNLAINRLREAIKARQPIVAAKDEKLETLLRPASAPSLTPHRTPAKSSPINGVEGLLYSLAGCCNPVPGEAIIGVVTQGSSRGISIHRQKCSNTENIPGERLIPVSWNSADSHRPATYPVQVLIEVIDRVGVLKDILSRLSDYDVNVRSAQVKTFPGQTAVIDLGIDITDHEQLERIFTQIRKMSDILQMRRVSQFEESANSDSPS
ncbi:MAG: bifunctional (p)ppGpp synthetase/guanosine-3',5'-bis(diphosphate) 3'-pyrophosphohydrolase [Pegethrix bostrychoides GSE-TBD4-15B]|jgi:GTP pyrophosphokinase|uniref:Bifunctional (P)ppGpp synthetase/guanosine-3',5'-bis(Diphosphate) 3'-pyrophosphohydrolase n=1 Tax=Pegethrix bostrychoides GSE-TBD4-15B TaxID=2839662 RepID=A0A951PAS5_9CYAN|nr:bifunctional (p)ppGpp synthetase/guanosine-3',5'-bis(diphosphate) 3'-pyrophosphohydrolase [Pegethrix bostrychoides GSE-TBD4-15B]